MESTIAEMDNFVRESKSLISFVNDDIRYYAQFVTWLPGATMRTRAWFRIRGIETALSEVQRIADEFRSVDEKLRKQIDIFNRISEEHGQLRNWPESDDESVDSEATDCALATLSSRLAAYLHTTQAFLERLKEAGQDNNAFFSDKRNSALKERIMQDETFKKPFEKYSRLRNDWVLSKFFKEHVTIIEEATKIDAAMNQNDELRQNCDPYVNEFIEKFKIYEQNLAEVDKLETEQEPDTELRIELEEFLRDEPETHDIDTSAARFLKGKGQRYEALFKELLPEVEELRNSSALRPRVLPSRFRSQSVGIRS